MRATSSERASPSSLKTAVSTWLAPSEVAYCAARSGAGDEPNTRYPGSADRSGIATRNTGRSSSVVSSAKRSTSPRADARILRARTEGNDRDEGAPAHDAVECSERCTTTAACAKRTRQADEC